MSLQGSPGTLATQLPRDMLKMMEEAAEKAEGQKDLVTWIKRNFHIPETKHDQKLKGRIGLQPYQEDALREALSRDENGNFKYSIIVWSDIKKSAKSTIAAAVNLARAWHSEWGEFYVIANDLKQADSRVANYLRRGVQLNPSIKRQVRMNGYKIIMPNGSFIEAIPIDPSGEAGSNADMLTWSELWGSNESAKQNMWCLDDKSEVLTKEGWKKGIELTRNDLVATYENGYVYWERPSSVFLELHKGKMHLYEHKNFSIMCTDKHRLYGRYTYRGDKEGKNKYDKFGVMTSEELRASGYSYYHPVSHVDGVDCDDPDSGSFVVLNKTKFHNELVIPFEKWAKFLGLYLTEGSTADYRGVPCNVRISQLRKPHPEKYDEIYEILKDVFGDWVKINKRDGFKISSTELAAITKKFGTTFQKRIPRSIIESNKETLENFLHCYILGDGHKVSNGSIQITCASKGMADDLQVIAFRLGKQSSVRRHMLLYWRVLIHTGNVSPMFQKQHWKEVDYDGWVWCPTVSTGLFIARREGRPFVTGNSEMTLSPTKTGQSFRWVESYAGFSGESVLLYSLYELGVKNGQMLWPDKLYPVTDGVPTQLELYVNPEARMLCLWNTQPRCPWQTKEYYASEAQVLPPSQFQRMHRNQWVSSTESFVPVEWFDACNMDSEWPEIPKNHPMVVALDAGVSGDSFGLWMGCRHPKLANVVLTQKVQRWVPPRGGKIDFTGTEDNPGPELVLRRLVKDNNVICVAYDQYELHYFCSRLYAEGLTWFKSFSQGNDRLIADSQVRDLIRERKFWHRGEPILREHVQNADAKIDTEQHKIRIIKRSEGQKVDTLVCASMGSYMVLYLNLA